MIKVVRASFRLIHSFISSGTLLEEWEGPGEAKNGGSAGNLSPGTLLLFGGLSEVMGARTREASRLPSCDNQTHRIPAWTQRRDESEKQQD